MADFDKYVDTYTDLHAKSTELSGEETSFFAEYKIQNVRTYLGQKEPVKILDFGSGIGNSVTYWRKYFSQSNLVCADISEKSLEIIHKKYAHESVGVVPIKDQSLNITNGTFSLVFSACVFHHIDAREHVHWLQEMRRLTSADGTVAIFEHNPLNPLTQKAVKDCPFDDDAVLITASVMRDRMHQAGWKNLRIRYVLFFPKFLAKLRFLEQYLFWLPLGAQYVVYGES